jgi:hypothetical protein
MLLKAVKNFFAKMVKPQEEYPIKYYKRNKPYQHRSNNPAY